MKIEACTRCNKEKTTEIGKARGHNFINYETTIAPTCTKEGTESATCVNCHNATDTRIIEALGHNMKDDVILPTCTEQGYTRHTCTRCDVIVPNSDYVNPIGHSLVESHYSSSSGENQTRTVYEQNCSNGCGYKYISKIEFNLNITPNDRIGANAAHVYYFDLKYSDITNTKASSGTISFVHSFTKTGDLVNHFYITMHGNHKNQHFSYGEAADRISIATKALVLYDLPNKGTYTGKYDIDLTKVTPDATVYFASVNENQFNAMTFVSLSATATFYFDAPSE